MTSTATVEDVLVSNPKCTPATAAHRLLVVGSVALDTIETPFGHGREILGGSATFFSAAASLFTQVALVAVVGEDFPAEHEQFLAGRGVDLRGLARVTGGRTFRWTGRYGYDLNSAQTLETQLNVFEGFDPRLPDGYAGVPYVFLANIDPELQLKVLEHVRAPKLVALDTMNFWISGKPDLLRRAIARANVLLLNDAELRQLTGKSNIVHAAREVLALGPSALVVKRGEFGAMLFTKELERTHEVFCVPAYPSEDVQDPTGAGDTFAGGFMGYLARANALTPGCLRQAVVAGSVMASFTVERFGTERLGTVTWDEIGARFQEFRKLTVYEDLALAG